MLSKATLLMIAALALVPTKAEAQSILIYGPAGSGGQAYFPGSPTVTIADDTTWRAMTTGDFGGYDMIWVDDAACASSSAHLQTLIDTQAAWGPAVTGRIALAITDASYHASGNANAQTFIRNLVNWTSGLGSTASGGQTGMSMQTGCAYYTDFGGPYLDSFEPTFGSPLTTLFINGEPSAIHDLTHPTMAGFTSISDLLFGYYGHGAVGIPFPTESSSSVQAHGGSGLLVRDEQATTCGDGIPDPGEECDDGNPDGNDGCTGCIVYADGDSDGFYADVDCDDASVLVNPAAAEICDGTDQNCNGAIDEGVTTTFYRDSDADGYGDVSSTMQACTEPVGFTTDATDCDDTNAAVHPGATELCDGIDNDCDSTIDEDALITFYEDADGDGYGDPVTTPIIDCTAPAGYVPNGTDCDDTRSDINPGEVEICDEIDNDCNSLVDDGIGGTFYRDTDMDGYGNPDDSVEACSAPAHYIADNTDCDDLHITINPAATELCDAVDNDCDTLIDEDGVCGPDPTADLPPDSSTDGSTDTAGDPYTWAPLDAGCACTVTPDEPAPFIPALLLLAGLMLLALRRRR